MTFCESYIQISIPILAICKPGRPPCVATWRNFQLPKSLRTMISISMWTAMWIKADPGRNNPSSCQMDVTCIDLQLPILDNWQRIRESLARTVDQASIMDEYTRYKCLGFLHPSPLSPHHSILIKWDNARYPKTMYPNTISLLAWDYFSWHRTSSI